MISLVKQPRQYLLRAVFYSGLIVGTFLLAATELNNGNILNFRLITVVGLILFLVELRFGWVRNSRRHKQVRLSFDRQEYISELLNHLLVPTCLYLGSLAFIYLNSRNSTLYLIATILFLLLTLLFTNISAYYKHQEKFWHDTHFIFDIAKFYLFFLVSEAVLNTFESNVWIAPLAIGITCAALLALTVLRYNKYEHRAAGELTIVGLIQVILIGIALLANIGNTVVISAFSVVIYYLLAGYIHHRMEGDLSKEILWEYAVVAALAIAIMFGLSDF